MHEHQVKIKQLRLQEIDQLIETKLFCKFLEKNMDTEAHVYIRFEEENLNTIFAAEIFEIIRFWTPKERIPIVSTAECKYM
uniref:Uncharacterized protein n=1 Tax=Panagrolaimus sp. ES5 TaxID=591445 RepID=A0AC34F566_9BILA